MTLQVGRVTGLRPDPDWSRSGDTITWSGTFSGTADQVDVLRMQVVNLAGNPDEEFVPVLWSGDPSIDGYYRVLDSDVSSLGPVGNGSTRWSITVERLANTANPRMEIAYMRAPRANDHSITPGSFGTIAALPTDTDTSDVDLTFAVGNVIATRTCVGGSVNLFRDTISAAARGAVLFSTEPDSYDIGGCLIEQKIGSDWYPVNGRQPVGRLLEWRISNGIIRLGTNANVAQLTFERWNGATWNTVDLTGTRLAGFGSTRHAMTIIRNDVDAVVVRCDSAGTSSAPGYRMFTIRRGCLHADIVMAHPGQLTFGFATTTASTALSPSTLGLRSTATQANGDAWFLACTETCSSNLTTGTLTQGINGPNLTTFIVGAAAPSGGSSPNRLSDVLDDVFTAAWAKTRLVVR